MNIYTLEINHPNVIDFDLEMEANTRNDAIANLALYLEIPQLLVSVKNERVEFGVSESLMSIRNFIIDAVKDIIHRQRNISCNNPYNFRMNFDYGMPISDIQAAQLFGSEK